MQGPSPDMHVQASLSIVVPVLNEIQLLPDLLVHLQMWRDRGHEIILVDGSSQDGTADQARKNGFTVLHSEAGRALQMNTGAKQAKGDMLLFLHADSILPDNADACIFQGFSEKQEKLWGRFDVNISGDVFMLKVVAWFMNWRSRLSGIATGDQGIFVERELFEAVGGFPEQPLMEDIELSKSLKKICRPLCIEAKLTTSGRRWIDKGVWRTIFLMWRLRWAYWRGMSSEDLAREYQ